MIRKILTSIISCYGLFLSAWAVPDCQAIFGEQALNTPQLDETNLPFVDDAQLHGYWVSVDFVDKIENFNPAKEASQRDLFLQEMIFLPTGKVVDSSFTWTKGHILNQIDKTNARYQIKQIDGKDYLFFEWKSGDYTCLGREPHYYVLQKKANLRTDKIDLPFKNDSQVIGQWKAIDFVFQPAQFTPGEKYWRGELYLKTLTLQAKGKTPSSPAITWTKGHVLHKGDQTDSAYQLKKIDGKTYMFLEWKSGDYLFRGEEPAYYVLEKADK